MTRIIRNLPAVLVVLFLGIMANGSNIKAEEITVTLNGTEYVYQECQEKPGSIEIIALKNASSKLVIPAKIDGKKVYRTYVKNDGDKFVQFNGEVDTEKMKIESIVIESGVKEIGEYSFGGIHAKVVSIPKSIEKIGASAFAGNEDVTSISLKNPKVKVGWGCFSGCENLKKVTFTSKTFTGNIGRFAFSRCGLRSLKIPYMKNMSSKKRIDVFAFSQNKKLEKITFSSKYKQIHVGESWFTDCPKSQIIIGKKIKTFSSGVNANAGSVRLLGKKTKVQVYEYINNKVIYYMQYKKVIVPKKSKAIKVLKKTYYGVVNDSDEERYCDDEKLYVENLKKIKLVIKY